MVGNYSSERFNSAAGGRYELEKSVRGPRPLQLIVRRLIIVYVLESVSIIALEIVLATAEVLLCSTMPPTDFTYHSSPDP